MARTFSPKQEEALRAVLDWHRSRSRAPVFRLFGYAGTGKTTLAIEIAERLRGNVAFASFTGKAALIMQTKGCEGASTIHSLIYRPIERDGVIEYVINQDSDLSLMDLVIIDECSMVNEELGRDLLSFDVPVLVLGDPAQLPPVRGEGFFTNAEPDVMLTEIHRQAADNPIIQMATAVREGRPLDFGTYGSSRVILRRELMQGDVKRAGQILVGTHRTRRSINSKARHLRGFQEVLPEPGDRLVCLKNNKRRGLLNGSLWDVRKCNRRGEVVRLDIDPADPIGVPMEKVRTARNFFDGTEDQLDFRQRRKIDEFDFGYALTVHKAQGSQWDDVIVFDESGVFREERHRWLYTAITRAAETVTVVR